MVLLKVEDIGTDKKLEADQLQIFRSIDLKPKRLPRLSHSS
jgi:hypothetical protein